MKIVLSIYVPLNSLNADHMCVILSILRNSSMSKID